MSKVIVVAGGGFRGFCDSLELVKMPGSTVHLIEPAPFFGGVMSSATLLGFAVDKGVHMFDSIPKPLAEIVDEIMEGRTRTIDFVSASAFNKVVTEGFSLPDLSSLEAKKKVQIKSELLALAASNREEPTPDNLHALFEQRYGKTAARVFADIFHNIYGLGASEVEANAIAQTSMGRLKFLSDNKMLELKQDPWLDTVLAARRKSVGTIDDLVSIYPDTGEAMRGWCERAKAWLETKGVQVRLGEKIVSITDSARGLTVRTDQQSIEADHVIWSNDNTSSLSEALGFEDNVSDYQHATPMLFITMITQADRIKDFTYLQNFDPDGLTYRTAATGLFSGQIRDDGATFITSECPVPIGGPLWEEPESAVELAWQECKTLGIVAPDARLEDSSVVRLPVTFKLARVGYTDKIAEFGEEITKRSDRVVLRNVVPFFRRDIYLDSLQLRSIVE